MKGRKLGLAGLIATGVGMAVGGGGCYEKTLTEGDLINASLHGYASKTGTVEAYQSANMLGGLAKTDAERRHDLNVAERGKTEVNVPQTDYPNSNQNSEKFRLFLCNKVIDINNDHLIDFDIEVFGLNKKVYNIDREEMHCALFNTTPGRVYIKSWTSDGRLIGETEFNYVKGYPFNGCFTGPNGREKGDFLDNIKGAGPGDYRITATSETGKTACIDVTIVRDKKK